MERTATIREEYNKENDEFVEVAVCPVCKKKVVGNPAIRKPYSDEHLVRTAHGCGGHVAVFRPSEADDNEDGRLI
jgi:hypothetical protein